MAAVHRYEGTVNQVMGDGIMALFGAPIAHEDHAVRACYAALAMQDAIRRYSDGGAPRAWHRGADPGRPPLGGGGGAGHRQRSAHGLLRHRPDHASGRPHGTVGAPGEHPADGRDLAAGRGVCPGHPLGSGAREGAGRPCGGVRAGRRRPGPHAPAGLGGAGADPLRGAAGGARGPAPGLGSRPRPGTAKWWPSSGTPGWAKPASSTSSPRPLARWAGSCWKAARPPMGRPPRICRSSTCSRPTFSSTTATTGGTSASKLTGRLLALDPSPRPHPAGLPGPPRGVGGGLRLAGPRPAATPPAHPGGPHPPVPAGEPGAAPPPGLREPALDRRGDPGVPRRPGGDACPPPACSCWSTTAPSTGTAGASKPSYTQLRLDPLPPASAEGLLQGLLGDDAGLAR